MNKYFLFTLGALAFFHIDQGLSETCPWVLPPVTEPPVTEPPVTEPPVTEPPVTEPPVTEPPVTEPPVTEAPGFENAEEYIESTRALFGETSELPDWFQQYVEAKLDRLFDLYENKPKTTLPNFTNLFTLSAKKMKNIDAPSWFTDYQAWLSDRKSLPKDEKPPIDQGFTDDMDSWFPDYALEVQARVDEA